ncbi:MAG: rhodanese-like domain-containing protein [Gemmatimonadetes bacterium]|nr:rhodanese-like domain-containing protein [Gemmatimonadota bacterium]
MVRKSLWWWFLPALVIVPVAGGCSRGETEAEAVEPTAEVTTPEDDAAALDEGAATSRSLTPDELIARMEEPEVPMILDVRSPKEYAEGHIPGAVNIPYDQLPDRIGELDEYRETGLVVYCRTGRRAGIAEETLDQAGFGLVWDLQGHMVAWQAGDYPLVVPVAN